MFETQKVRDSGGQKPALRRGARGQPAVGVQSVWKEGSLLQRENVL